jgi:hypothetical protein
MKQRGRSVRIAAIMLGVFGLTARETPSVSAAPNPCAAISIGSLSDYARVIAEAHRWAVSDVSKNGSTGKYAVAATNSRDQLKRAHDRALAAVADLRKFDPSVTTAAEAGTIKEHLRFILELVPQAAHWAMISEIYHDSRDARQAVEGSVQVLQRGVPLYAESARCYMDGL